MFILILIIFGSGKLGLIQCFSSRFRKNNSLKHGINVLQKQCRNCVVVPTTNVMTPMYLSWYNQRHQSLYSAALLLDAGLRAGDRIREIAMRLAGSSYITLKNFQVHY